MRERFFQASPRLRELQLRDSVDPVLAEAIQCDKLTTLTLHKVMFELPNEHFIKVLPKLVALRGLSISLPYQHHLWQRVTSKAHAINLPALQRLTIVGHCNACLESVLSQFHLPSIIDPPIHTNEFFSPKTGLHVDLKSFFDECNAKLLRLSFRVEKAIDFEKRHVPILKHVALQDLVEIRLGGIVTQKTISILTCQPSATPLIPHLKQLHFESARTSSTLDVCPLTRLVLSRSAHTTAARLQGVKVGFQLRENLEAESVFWDAHELHNPGTLGNVDRRFSWVGTNTRRLHREFMVNDFSLIQGWIERDF